MGFRVVLLIALSLLGACQIRLTPRELEGDPANQRGGLSEPAYYQTPSPVGVGTRRIDVVANNAASLLNAFNNAKAGDRIVVPEGNYLLSGPLTLSASGTVNAWIQIQAAPNATPTLNFNNNGAIRVTGSYIWIEGLEVFNAAGTSIRLEPTLAPMTDIVLRNMKVGPAATGPGAAVAVNRNSTSGASITRVYLEACDLEQAIGAPLVDTVGTSQTVVRDCDLHAAAFAWGATMFRGGSREILFERNLVRGVQSAPAVTLGGYSDPFEFDPNFTNVEASTIVARNNIVVDCDDDVFEARGIENGKIYHNTILTQSDAAIFALSYGNTASGFPSGNQLVDIANNLVVSMVNTPNYARNDANALDLRFGPHLWTGEFKNSATPSLPNFPTDEDFPVQAANAPLVLVNPTFVGLSGLVDAKIRFHPAPYSAAYKLGMQNSVVPFDLGQLARDRETPTVGAFE